MHEALCRYIEYGNIPDFSVPKQARKEKGEDKENRETKDARQVPVMGETPCSSWTLIRGSYIFTVSSFARRSLTVHIPPGREGSDHYCPTR